MLALRSGLCAVALMGAACGAPAMAQVGLCAGLGDGAPWLGQTQAGSDIATAPVAFGQSGLAVGPGARAVALFSLSAPMAVRVEAAPEDAVGDPVLEVFDATGRLVVFDDDSGGGPAARAEPRLEAGDYCVAVSGFGGQPVRASLQVSRLEMAALTPGLTGGFEDSLGQAPFVGIAPCLPETPATPLGQGPIDASLPDGVRATGRVTENPYFRFSLAAAQSLSIRAENPDADPYLYVFDAQGWVLDENDDYDSLDAQVDFIRPLPAGTYCIGVRALWDATLPITVRVFAHDARAAAVGGYSTGEIAPPLDGSWPVEDLGRVAPQISLDRSVVGDQAHWIAFDLAQAGLILITADALDDSDPVIGLFDAKGQMVGYNDDVDDGLNAMLALPVAAGQYRLAVRQFAQDGDGMIRIGLSRYVLAER